MKHPRKTMGNLLGTVVFALIELSVTTGAAQGDTTLLAWDVADEDLWSIDTAVPLASTFIGGGNATSIAEIEYGFGVVYGADTAANDGDLYMIDPSTGLAFNSINLTYPPEGNVITALEFVGGTLYAGLTTRGGGSTFLSTIELVTGIITVVGDTGVTFPFGGLAYDIPNTTLYGITSGGSAATLYTVDTGTGTATSVGQVTVSGMLFGATALEFGDDGVLYTVPAMTDLFFGHLLTIDPLTALATDLGNAGLTGGAVALTFQDPAEDEPDTSLAAWDSSGEDLWRVETAPPISTTFVGGGNTSRLAEIEYRNGVIYGANTSENTDFHMIDFATGLIFDTLTLTFPAQGDVLTALEFVDSTLYAGLTTEGGGPTYLTTVDLTTGTVSLVGATGVGFPFGGLAYEESTGTLFGISSGGSNPTLYTVNTTTGAATALAPVTFGGLPFRTTALEFGDDGLLYTAAAQQDVLFGHVFTINAANGIASDLGDTGMLSGPVALAFTGVIFEDGFESGDTTVWSLASP